MQQQDDDVAAGVVPPVTVVLDGRCICHRILLTRHTGYRSLAGALRRMFVDADAGGDEGSRSVDADHGLDLSNAVPGHVVAYEDMEDDLLLAGDLNWKDFVRVAKRIWIIPAKSSNRRKQQCGGVGGARGREAGLLRAHGRAGGRVPRPVLPQRRAAAGGPALDGAAGRSGLRRARRQVKLQTGRCLKETKKLSRCPGNNGINVRRDRSGSGVQLGLQSPLAQQLLPGPSYLQRSLRPVQTRIAPTATRAR